MKTIMYLRTLSLDLITEAWAQEAKDTSNATIPLSTCSLPTFLPLPTSTQQFTTKSRTINKALAHALARCSLLLLGSDALTTSIIQQVWGANDTIQQKLGGPRGDLSLIRRRLVLLSKIAINTYHLWATTIFNNERIINYYALRCHPQGFQDIIKFLQVPTTAEYVREPLAPGTLCINILLMNMQCHQSLIHHL